MIQDIHFWEQISLISLYQNYCRQHNPRQVKLTLMYAHRSLCLVNSPKQGGKRPCVLGNFYLWPENEPISISFLFITGHVLFTREASIYFGKFWEIGTIVENKTKFGKLGKFRNIGYIGKKLEKLRKFANWKNWEKLKLGKIKIKGKIKIGKNKHKVAKHAIWRASLRRALRIAHFRKRIAEALEWARLVHNHDDQGHFRTLASFRWA